MDDGATFDRLRDLAERVLGLHAVDLAGALQLLAGRGGQQAHTSSYNLKAGQTTKPVTRQLFRSSLEEADHACVDSHIDVVCVLKHAPEVVLQQLSQYLTDCGQGPIPFDACAVCGNEWCAAPPVRCSNDGCKVSVHPDCYGLLERDTGGAWMCWECDGSPIPTCAVCHMKGGAQRRLEDGRCAHILCVIYTPEMSFGDSPKLEPIVGIDRIPKGRRRVKCNVCNTKGGAVVMCSASGCKSGFHAVCAREVGVLKGNATNPLAAFCLQHLPSTATDSAKDKGRKVFSPLAARGVNRVAGSPMAGNSPITTATKRTRDESGEGATQRGSKRSRVGV